MVWKYSQSVVLAAACGYVVAHLLVLSLFPGAAKAISYGFLILAPLLAAGAVLVCARSSQAALNWYALALSLCLWDVGIVATWYMDVVAPVTTDLSGLSMLFYVLYGVPLTFIVASSNDEIWPARVIDAVLALALGGLFFAGTFTFATMAGANNAGMLQLRLMLDVQNLFIFVFNLVRCQASTDRFQKDFFRITTVFSGVYLLVAAYINHHEMNSDYGGSVDVLIDIPFLILAVLASRRFAGPPESRTSLASPKISMIVRAASPIMLPLTLFAISCLLVFYKPVLAVLGFVIALVGYGARTVLVQLRVQADKSHLEHLSRIDGLTELANRRHFDETLSHEFKRALRSRESLSLLMVDIDHFKMLNDSYGHPEGDQYLRRISRALNACASRSSDLVARYGGEEFAIVMPGTDAEAAAHIAHRMLSTVVGLALPSPSVRGVVTISIGLASTEGAWATEGAQLVAAADAALYKAKQSGRNQVVQSDDTLRAMAGHPA